MTHFSHVSLYFFFFLSPRAPPSLPANPVVHSVFSSVIDFQPDLAMLSIVVDRASYKDLSNLHHLKLDSQLQLQSIPTLFKFIEEECVDRLVEGQCTELQNVFEFIREKEEGEQ